MNSIKCEVWKIYHVEYGPFLANDWLKTKGTGRVPRGVLIFSYIHRLGLFFRFKILNFNIFWGFQKNEIFWGYEDFGTKLD